MISVTDVLLFVSLVVLTILIIYTRAHKKASKTHKYVYVLFCMLLFHVLCMLSQSLLADKLAIEPVYFEYFTGLVASYTPVICFMISKSYYNEEVNLEKYRSLYIFPTLMLVGLWTNDLHNSFYVKYSTLLSESQNGILFSLNAIYSYVLIGIALFTLLSKSYKMSGFFSKQTLLLVLGVFVVIFVNILGAFKIISMSVYIMPILFSFVALCFALAIIKLKALNIIPVAIKTIMDTMTDSFVVISKDGTIADLNQTFIDNFKYFGYVKDKDNLYDWMREKGFVDIKQVKHDVEEAHEKGDTVTKEYHIERDTYDKYFEVDYKPIKSNIGEEYVATLILLRDVTTLKKDTEIMLKNESLVMLGELAGGVAHDINTPISAIKSGLLILKETVKTDDEKMLVERMDSCANKIVTLTNSLRNQIRNIGSDEVTDVNVTTVITDMATIIHNDLTKHKVKLNLDIKENIIVKGNAAKLSQVVTNIVINAIQAYNEKGGEVNLSVYNEGNNSVIAIEDFAGGIPEHIRENIGKNILTTKGVSGTGFGLYLAYSVIKGAFGGEITFDTELGKGTTFYITIPR